MVKMRGTPAKARKLLCCTQSKRRDTVVMNAGRPFQRQPLLALLGVLAQLLIAPPVDAATLQVGPDKPYTTVRAASQAAQNGDVVEIDAGIYSQDVTTWSQSNLTVRGVGGRAYMRADGAQQGGKGTWVVYGSNFTAENIEFSGASVPDQNGAGIRADGSGNLVVRNCWFHDNEEGILGGCDSVLVENSIFDHNGYGDGQSHNIYIVHTRTFTMQNCYTHRAIVGHNIKTRARNNFILYNRIMDEADGTGSYSVDAPDGGLTYMIGNVVEQGPNTENSSLVSYAEESASNGALELYVVNNTFVNNRTSGGIFLQIRAGTVTRVVNNIFYGPGTRWSSGATVTASNNYFQSSYNNSPGFRNPSVWDFHLTAASPSSIVDAGVDPGTSPSGFRLAPPVQYVYDAQIEPRLTVGALDIGAFEYSSSAQDGTPPDSIKDLRKR
jgi:Right handed beta helix region